MIELLLNSIIPVASIVLLGFVSTKLNFFNYKNGIILTQFVGKIGVPCLVINIITSIEVSNLPWLLIFGYLVSEIIIFTLAILISHFFFNKDIIESIIIGMASAFANHLFFVYPIAKFEYQENLVLPIIGVIGVDILFLVFTIFLLDTLNNTSNNLKLILFRQFKNPPLIGLIIGLFFVNTNFEMPIFFQRTITMVSDSAIPCGLFATGIFLSTKIEENMLGISFLISFLKIFVHPLIAVFVIKLLFDISFELSKTTIMVAAAPVGLMALTYSSTYGVRPEMISRAILITTFLSLITIPVASSL